MDRNELIILGLKERFASEIAEKEVYIAGLRADYTQVVQERDELLSRLGNANASSSQELDETVYTDDLDGEVVSVSEEA